MTEKEHTAWQAGWQSAILDMVNEDKYAGLITAHHQLEAERDRLQGIINEYVETIYNKLAYIGRVQAERDRLKELAEKNEQAADALWKQRDRLREKNARLRDLLEEMVDLYEYDDVVSRDARAALAEQEKI
jgi:hypothetical protein